MYLRVSTSMISAHCLVAFVCKTGEVITADSCSGCESSRCVAQGNLSDRLEWSPDASPLRMRTRTAPNTENTLNRYENIKPGSRRINDPARDSSGAGTTDSNATVL